MRLTENRCQVDSSIRFHASTLFVRSVAVHPHFALVAERLWKLARHAVSGIRRKSLRPEGTLEIFHRPFRTDFLLDILPGTMCRANFRCRSATDWPELGCVGNLAPTVKTVGYFQTPLRVHRTLGSARQRLGVRRPSAAFPRPVLGQRPRRQWPFRSQSCGHRHLPSSRRDLNLWWLHPGIAMPGYAHRAGPIQGGKPQPGAGANDSDTGAFHPRRGENASRKGEMAGARGKTTGGRGQVAGAGGFLPVAGGI